MKYIFLFCFTSQVVFAQFAPPQGQTGSTAMYKDSSAFVAWAKSSKIIRGLQNISYPSLGYATVGDSTSPIGIADGTVVSLGDSGVAICSFQNELYDGLGYDFAVFENSFDGNFLELGFVEVSSDGVNFFRFPATSNTQDTTQTGTYGDTDATKVDNLGGKYKVLYGTPFDLSQMQDINGLDINHVKQVKVIDVVGSITVPYATYDKNNNKVNDPWPTPFASCGFDLDAVGVINQQTTGIKQLAVSNEQITVYPNPASTTLNLKMSQFNNLKMVAVEIINVFGEKVYENNYQISTSPNYQIDVSGLSNGVYFVTATSGSSSNTKKIIISK